MLEVKSKIKEVFILLCNDTPISNTKWNEILVSYTYSYWNGLFKVVEETKNTAQYEEIKTLYDELLAFRKLEQCYRFDWRSNWHYVFYDKYEVNYTIVQKEENGERINKYTLTINEIVSSQ